MYCKRYKRRARGCFNRSIEREREERREAMEDVEEKVDALRDIQSRLARMEGELRGVLQTLNAIQQWFISGKKE